MERPIRVGWPSGVVETVELEIYLRWVVPCEVYPSWPNAVLDAQAICARSYAVAAIASSKHHNDGYDVCTKQCCQVFDSSRENAATNAAVERTRGIVGVTGGGVAKMFYSAACGGSTLDHWDPSYLRIVGCPCGPHKAVNGHRQGMCQWGAYYCVKDWNFTTWKQILDHYFNLEYRYDYGQGALVFPNGEEEPDNDILKRLAALEAYSKNVFENLDSRLETVGTVLENMNKRLEELESWATWADNFVIESLIKRLNDQETIISGAVHSILALEEWIVGFVKGV